MNVYFLTLFVSHWFPLAVLVGLLLATFALGELKVRFEGRLPGGVWAGLVVLLWAFLFVAKDHDLLGRSIRSTPIRCN